MSPGGVCTHLLGELVPTEGAWALYVQRGRDSSSRLSSLWVSAFAPHAPMPVCDGTALPFCVCPPCPPPPVQANPNLTTVVVVTPSPTVFIAPGTGWRLGGFVARQNRGRGFSHEPYLVNSNGATESLSDVPAVPPPARPQPPSAFLKDVVSCLEGGGGVGWGWRGQV